MQAKSTFKREELYSTESETVFVVYVTVTVTLLVQCDCHVVDHSIPKKELVQVSSLHPTRRSNQVERPARLGFTPARVLGLLMLSSRLVHLDADNHAVQHKLSRTPGVALRARSNNAALQENALQHGSMTGNAKGKKPDTFQPRTLREFSFLFFLCYHIGILIVLYCVSFLP